MAKTKISELEKMYGADRKEIIAFLNEKGVEAKTASSSVDEAGVKLVEERFGKKTAAASASKAESAKAEKAAAMDAAKETSAASAAPTAPAGTAQTSEKPAGGSAPDRKPAQAGTFAEKGATLQGGAAASGAPGAPAAPKKKKIIIVTGNNNSSRQSASYSSGYQRGGVRGTPGYGSYNAGQSGRGGQGRGNQPQGRGGNNSGRMEAQTQYHPIKPKTTPTQMGIDYHTPEELDARRRAAEAKAAAERAAAEAAEREKQLAAEEAARALAAKEEAARAAAAADAEKAQAPASTDTAATEAGTAAETAKAAGRTQNTAGSVSAQGIRDSRPAGARTGAASQGSYGQGGARNDRGGYGNRGGQGGYSQGGARTGQGEYRRTGGNGGYAGRTGAPGQGGYGQGTARTGQGEYRRTGGNGGYAGPARGGQGGFGNRGGYGQGAQGGPGRGSQGGFGQNRGGRPGGAAGGFGGGAPGQGRQDSKRRGPQQDRDKRSRKDLMYIEDEKQRKNRAGRFIKPEKHEEALEEQIKVITIPEKLTIRELAEAMHMQPGEIIKKLFLAGKVMTPNSEVTYEEAENIAADYEILCEKEEAVDVIEELLREEDDAEETLVTRAPVVCVMGHVDHGKTSLLDVIRMKSLGIEGSSKEERRAQMQLRVAGKEAGGITQAIGAYTVGATDPTTGEDRTITFLDTPGHEAFTQMRMRGANSTDIAILVVAADDGVMPQTVEAINHAKAAGIEIIVAVNKIDKPGANPDHVLQQLSEHELIPTAWGGTTEFVKVSAKTGEGIDDLLETILLTADVLELKANPNRKARALVLEAKLDKGRGPVANVLIQKGTLKVGDFISAGAASGKVRAMINDRGENVKKAGPSQPVEILGLNDVPSAGEVLVAHEDNDTAKQYAATYKLQHKEELLEETRMRMSLDDLFTQMQEGNLKEFDIIIKADVQGSVEALKSSLLKLSNDEIMVKCIHSGVGNINESDVSLASASNAIIIGFNVKPDAMARSMADREGVEIRLYDVIYRVTEEVEAALKGMRAPVYEEKVIGHAEVRQLFKSGKIGNIAGSMVIDGVVQRDCKIRLRRGDEQIYEGSLASLKRFKDDVKEVKEGFECGLVFKDYDEMQVGDIAEAYIMVEVDPDKL